MLVAAGFITGGLVVAITMLLAKRSAKSANVFWSFPALALVALFFIWCQNGDTANKFARNLLISYAVLVTFAAVLWLLMRQGLTVWPAVAGALVGWLIAVCVLQKFL